eukprot:359338-Chlamydomonas_euryale.AAC.2
MRGEATLRASRNIRFTPATLASLLKETHSPPHSNPCLPPQRNAQPSSQQPLPARPMPSLRAAPAEPAGACVSGRRRSSTPRGALCGKLGVGVPGANVGRAGRAGQGRRVRGCQQGGRSGGFALHLKTRIRDLVCVNLGASASDVDSQGPFITCYVSLILSDFISKIALQSLW